MNRLLQSGKNRWPTRQIPRESKSGRPDEKELGKPAGPAIGIVSTVVQLLSCIYNHDTVLYCADGIVVDFEVSM